MILNLGKAAGNLFNELKQYSDAFIGIQLGINSTKGHSIIVVLSYPLPEAIVMIPESYEGYKVSYTIEDPDHEAWVSYILMNRYNSR